MKNEEVARSKEQEEFVKDINVALKDLIDRQDVEKAIQGLHIGDVNFFSKLRERIDAIPSAEPERISMVWKPAKGRPAYEKGICNCGYVLSVLQRDFVYCPNCGAKLNWSE